jgi:16S rRNA (cytidine1402-2'-O)-methyltransferase
MQPLHRGTLYLVPTPLGNLKDITIRALEVLYQVDFILCEDTRNSSRLLSHYQIKKPLSPYHQHNEHKIWEHITDQLSAGATVGLITDAGTPGISDPGYLLVRGCLNRKIRVECLPGATAFVPALVNSGLPAHQFLFEGFLPLKKGRKTKLLQLSKECRTMIFYESPVRLLRTLHDFLTFFGADRQVSVSRELTKLHEENFSGDLTEVCKHFSEKPIKGEIVIVVAGSEKGKI